VKVVNDTRRARSRAGLLGLAMALQVAAAAGCGDDAADTGAFIGTWAILEGNAVACQSLSTSLMGAQVKMTAGSDAPLQVDVRGCLLKFDVKGSTATARADQTCQTTFSLMDQNLAVDLAISKADFTVAGGTGTLKMTGTATTSFLPGGACPYEAMATASKITP
jgi:hypothetical protein